MNEFFLLKDKLKIYPSKIKIKIKYCPIANNGVIDDYKEWTSVRQS